MTSMLHRLGHLPKKKYPMADKIAEMKEEWSKLRTELAELNLMPSKSHSRDQKMVASPEVGETLIVGIQRIMAEISASVDTSAEGPVIVPISGDGGSGRSALARIVFNHTRFEQYYRVWVHPGMVEQYSLKYSREYAFLKYPRDPARWKPVWDVIGWYIISQLSGGEEEVTNGGSSNDNMDYITNRLHCLLKGTRVLVVLHNFNCGGETGELKRMLGAGSNGVIVMIADRQERCTASWDPALNVEECWTIIKQRSGFEDRSESDRQELERIGTEIASLCHGVLPAQLLGSILQDKDATGWAESLDSDFWDGFPETNPALKLAYTSMPPRLRLCFAYCAMFPVGRTVAKHDLIHQWIALGLVEPSATELGEQYISTLMSMSLLQTTKPDSTSVKDDKGAILLTMHEQAHHLATIATHDKFGFLRGATEAYYLPFSYRRGYRYALVNYFSGFPKVLCEVLSAQLRALHYVECNDTKPSDQTFSAARCLRVLEILKHSMQKLPDSICRMRHLRYLKLSECPGLVTLPKSFGEDLSSLFHIDLSHCSGLETLPQSLGKLINLLHINLSGCSKLEKLPESLTRLIKLVRIDLSLCSGLVYLPQSLGKLKNLVHINLSGCCGLVKLPLSFGKLMNVQLLNLSGCSGLLDLPQSLGKLINMLHINLSDCSRLMNLPGSFVKLINLVHADFSGCSQLVNLPKSFGGLSNLLHINLSGCHGLSNLPQSFSKLKKLEHLDLSFWSCFGVIQTALDGSLTGLQHLNLSHPLLSQPHLEGLQEVWSKHTSLRYLNLSMFLNPTFDAQSQVKTQVLKTNKAEIHTCIQLISRLLRLEHLDLSHNMFLRDVPECLGDLSNLHTLDLSGCIRLEKVAKRIFELKSLKSILVNNCRSLKSYHVVVQAADDLVAHSSGSSNLVQLEEADFEEIEISCLQKAKSTEEAKRVRLAQKRKLEKLKLSWTVGCQRYVEDKSLLGELVPPQSLQCLELRGYSGKLCLAAWWTNNLLNLAEVTLEDVSMCSQLPPLGVLPNLQRVVLRRMSSLISICASHLNYGNKPAFQRLSQLTIDDMGSLQQFHTEFYAVGGELIMFPAIDELVIRSCPSLMFHPHPPTARLLTISACDHLMYHWQPRGGSSAEGPCTAFAPVHELIVENCRVILYHWYLLHYLPGLSSLTIRSCQFLDSSPEIIWALSSSLETLCFSDCQDITSLPQHLGDLASLRELFIQRCDYITSFPDSIRKFTRLNGLYARGCQGLRKFFRREYEQMLAHIPNKQYGSFPPKPNQQSLESNVGEGDGSEPFASSQHPIQMQPSLAERSQRSNGSRPLGSPLRDIYLT